jgi:phosphoribosylaminoimidazole-succinocarboxamide synthase
MLTREELRAALPLALNAFDLPAFGPKTSGKVREIYRQDGELLLVTTDRLSAFDHILGLVPYKGQVLNQLAAFWFDANRDIVPNHLVSLPDPNVAVVRACRPLPVEVVVRGYITGVTQTALWYRYSQGERHIYGLDFPDGLQKNDRLPAPIITPTTKARDGGHDERITSEQIVAQGLIAADVWARVSAAALAVFRRGQEIAQRAGLILVDTKYEFGLDSDGQVTLIDEVHTPDSSRFWLAGSYPARHAADVEPENFDKEFIRLYYAEHGYRGDGAPFALPSELAVQAAERYIRTYEMLTGTPFVPAELPAAPRIARALAAWRAAQGQPQ